jgi:hypothetical protein
MSPSLSLLKDTHKKRKDEHNLKTIVCISIRPRPIDLESRVAVGSCIEYKVTYLDQY